MTAETESSISNSSSTAKLQSGDSVDSLKVMPVPVHADGKWVQSGDFESDAHFYPRVLNAQIHPLVSSFFSLGNERIIARYTHLNPRVDEDALRRILSYKPQYFAWAGCDLFNVTDFNGHRSMIVIETNSCPSGQKSMPLVVDSDEYGGYRTVMDHTFRCLLEKTDPHLGGLAVVYDKNPMEASGYAAVMADLMNERVFLVEYRINEKDPAVKWQNQIMYIRDRSSGNEEWLPIRACFRYVTQKPWNRFPLYSRTLVLNSIISCLAGGRNKMMADRAYDFYNAELESENTGLSIRAPETRRNVDKNEIPMLVGAMGGHAVIKVPYSNAGQGVYTITNKEELEAFMAIPHHYNKFIVQSLVGNASWSSITRSGKYYHVGTVPNRRNQTFVSDLRMMVAGNASGLGFQPVAIYARRARKPLINRLENDPATTSWEMLGTNLSVKVGEDVNGAPKFTTETQRLVLMDRKDFNALGLGIDDLIDGYVQTVLSVIAIDKMCRKLMPEETLVVERPITAEPPELTKQPVAVYGEAAVAPLVEHIGGLASKQERVTTKQHRFDLELFRALNPDEALLEEIAI